MTPSSVQKCVRHHSVLSDYIVDRDEYAMVPKATPYFVAQARFTAVQKLDDQKSKVSTDCRWFSDIIPASKSVSELAEVFSNFLPMARSAGLTEDSRATICHAVSKSFQNIEWGKWTDGTINTHIAFFYSIISLSIIKEILNGQKLI